MEKAVFPLMYMNITQGVNGSATHLGSKAIDLGNRGQKEPLYAPFDGIIKKVYKTSGNFVWFESKEKVSWADGTEDYMTVLTGHDDNVESLYVGKEFKKGDIYYAQGSSGNTTTIHVHTEVGRGKFTGNGWHKNDFGVWIIDNNALPFDAFFVKEDTVIDNDGGYVWKKMDVSRQLQQEPSHSGDDLLITESTSISANRNEETTVMVIKGEQDESLEKIFTCEKDGTYYLKLYTGEVLYIGNVNKI